MSISAYKRTIRESESPRQIEARVFARITGAMDFFRADYEAAGDRIARTAVLGQGLRTAIGQNRQLWVRLREDLTSDANALPETLRANLLSISMWVDRTCEAVIGGGAGLGALIDVNQNILAGLTSQRPALSTVDTSHGPESRAEAL
ncbi:flagellar biosynthesis regulator FlaF [Sagittula salina]|uniref:FlaF protein n=1 Tax=Sagittula salina TaxID=2820268 RepID=A0A940MRH2_9RHOB|nr:flagellar biosynthesis regulator FlaF [Sagittula salina]MBP0484588.1 flaF protein [Sagittula salina]